MRPICGNDPLICYVRIGGDLVSISHNQVSSHESGQYKVTVLKTETYTYVQRFFLLKFRYKETSYLIDLYPVLHGCM